MSVAQPDIQEEVVPAAAPETTSNPLAQLPVAAPPRQKDPQPMLFNPLIARGSPFKAPAAPSVTAPEPAQAVAASDASSPEAGAVSPLSEGHVLPPSSPVDVVAEAELESQQPVDVDIPPPVEALPQVSRTYPHESLCLQLQSLNCKASTAKPHI